MTNLFNTEQEQENVEQMLQNTTSTETMTDGYNDNALFAMALSFLNPNAIATKAPPLSASKRSVCE